MKNTLLLLLLFIVLGCSVFDESDTLPAFLELSDVQVVTANGQGASTHNITDAWVAAEGQTLGVFPLPAIAPALFENEVSTIDVFAGIRNNGIGEEALIYPFYNRIQLDLALDPGEEIEIPLDFEYDPETQFRMIADFENQNLFNFDEDGDGDLGFSFVEDDPAEGSKSGSISIDENGKTIEIATNALFQLPLDNRAIFLEMDYKGDMEILVGMTGVRNNNIFKNFFIVLRPRAEWNKIYIDLSGEVGASQLQAYRIILGTQLTSGQSGQVFFDNIKLLHF